MKEVASSSDYRGGSVTYYDAIANSYDTKMEDEKIRAARAFIRDYFVQIPSVDRILDFGAGTGSDLEWQLKKGYQVLYYEPSLKMAEVADAKFKIKSHPQIEVLSGNKGSLIALEKFREHKIDAVFSNFAAINSVRDLDGLFGEFSQILKEEGSVVCVLQEPIGWKNKLKSMLRIGREPDNIEVRSDDTLHSMTVFLHSKNQIIRAARQQHLKLLFDTAILNSGFRLFHFSKRESK